MTANQKWAQGTQASLPAHPTAKKSGFKAKWRAAGFFRCIWKAISGIYNQM
jgi:hypothetical protein